LVPLVRIAYKTPKPPLFDLNNIKKIYYGQGTTILDKD